MRQKGMDGVSDEMGKGFDSEIHVSAPTFSDNGLRDSERITGA